MEAPMRKCSKCGVEKLMIKEHFAAYLRKGTEKFRPECRKCNNEMCRAYKAGNRKKISTYNHEYKAANTEKTRNYNREYFRNRRQNDFAFRVKVNHRSRVSTLIKGIHKSQTSGKLVACPHDSFMEWIEYQLYEFEDLTLDNYGEIWHLDHVKPCASFDLTQEKEQRNCFHWSNFRPMKAAENIEKGDKVDENVMNSHKLIVQSFLTETTVGREGNLDMEYSLYK